MPIDESVRKLDIVTAIPDRAMVVFAHPDDAEIGSGGVIAKWVAAGCEVTYVLCTNGGAGTSDRSLTPGYPDGALQDSREFLGDVVRAIRQYRPHTVFAHDPYRMKGFQHRDHRMVGMVTTDAVYPFARDHLHFPEHITDDKLEPHRVRELWYWGMDEPEIIVDVTGWIDKQVAALVRHESQVPGFNVPPGETIGARVKQNAAERAQGYGFEHGAVFRRLIARR